MNRIEFMKELEYLLQDIPDEEKADALDYYRDYLEEAGAEQEQDVLHEFGSPERIAAMIRSDLHGGMDAGGEFTDYGYQDSRFDDPRYGLANRIDVPEVQEQYEGNSQSTSGSYGAQGNKQQAANQAPGHKGLKVFLIIVLICLASPLLVGVGGGLLGLFCGIVAVLLGVAVSIAALTFAFFIAAIALVGFGFAQLFVVPLQGLLVLGLGILFLGLALLSLVLAILFYGKLVPAVIRGCADLVNRSLLRKGGVKA